EVPVDVPRPANRSEIGVAISGSAEFNAVLFRSAPVEEVGALYVRRTGTNRWAIRLKISSGRYARLLEKLSEREVPILGIAELTARVVQSISGVKILGQKFGY